MLARKTELIDVDAIQLGDRLRQANAEAVASLQASMDKIGLRTPITVRMMDADAISEPMLVSGLHRLEAAKALGWQQIECFVVDHETDDEARMWEIAENLHRAELTALERSEHIAEWVRLADRVSLQVATKPQGGRPEKGVRAAARELGIESTEAHRATKVASLTDEAKEAAREVGLDDNRSALLQAARQAPERQAQAVREIAEARASKIDRDVKDRAANEVAQIIAEYVPGEWWDALKANLYAAGANNIANALTNTVGQSIMDKRFGND